MRLVLICLLALSGCHPRPVDPPLPPPVPARASHAPGRYAVVAVPTTITLLWDYTNLDVLTWYSTNGGLVFTLHSHTNLFEPRTNWPVEAVVYPTNAFQTNYSAVVPATGLVKFFYVTAEGTNALESDPSNVIIEGPGPFSPLRISR